MSKCTECDNEATFIVWGCCDYYRFAMCMDCADMAVVQDWGHATPACEPTSAEPMAEWLERSPNRWRNR
jgi:hypothetical protein